MARIDVQGSTELGLGLGKPVEASQRQTSDVVPVESLEQVADEGRVPFHVAQRLLEAVATHQYLC